MNDTISESIAIAAETSEIFGMSLPLTGFPALDIYIITLFAALFINLVNKYFTDQARIRALKLEMKDLQKKMRKAIKDDPKKAQKLQQQIMKKNFENIKIMMSPKILAITMVPLLFLFLLVSKNYTVFGQFLNLGFTTFGWLGSYIIFSLINSIILKKALNVA